LKLAFHHEIPPFTDTKSILEKAVELGIGFVDPEHSAIGEQVGVRRTWIAEALGEGEVVATCQTALNAIGQLVAETHRMYGMTDEHDVIATPIDDHRVLLESDVDPSLPKKWGW
jgi:hypothetical protein